MRHARLVLTFVVAALALGGTGCTLVTPFGSFGAEDAGTVAADGATDAGTVPDAGRDASYPDAPGTFALSVHVTGVGHVRATALGLDCADDCRIPVAMGASVSLVATGDAAHTFSGWGGDCASSGNETTCTITMTADRSVTASFVGAMTTLQIGVSGMGRVTSDGGAIDCGSGATQCSVELPIGTHVALHATATAPHVFGAWSGTSVCTDVGSADCAFDLAGPTTLQATFTDGRPVLSVSVDPGGSVTSTPDAIIACPGDCDEVVSPGTTVTLVAMAAEGYEVAAWEGCTAGPADRCSLTIPTGTTHVAVVAHFRPVRHTVSVTILGGATSGSVSSMPAGLACTGSACTMMVDHGTSLELTATAALHYELGGWSGLSGCSGASCSLVVNADVSGTVAFARARRQVSVTLSGGDGTVRSLADGIDCAASGGATTGSCEAQVVDGTPMDFDAVPAPGYELASWGGDCAGTSGSTCSLTVGLADVSVSATFARARHDLDVTAVAAMAAGLTGSGSVAIAPAPSVASCVAGAAPCVNTYDHATMVTLTAMHPATVAVTWGADCALATGDTCMLTMTAAHSARATFTPISNSLNVTVTGSGRVSSVGGTQIVDCRTASGDCSETVGVGEMVTLRAYPDAGNDFTGWSGGCTASSGDCTVTVDMLTNVVASFAPTPRRLTVSVVGAEGRAQDLAHGVDCAATGPGTCVVDLPHGTFVSLAAVETLAYRLQSWSGDCTGTGTCDLTMTAPRAATATFVPRTFDVRVTLSGTGQGRVTGNGLDCGNAPGSGSTCVVTVPYGTAINLAAAPGAGSGFDGWSSGCSGTGACMRTITSDTVIDASFGPVRHDITVQLAPATGGTVTARVNGTTVLTCTSASCVVRIANGDTVTLTATGASGHRFGSWSRAGCLAGLPCTFTVTGPETVTASFVRRYTLTVTTTGPSGNTIEAWSPATNTPIAGTSGCFGSSACTFQLDEGTVARIDVRRTPGWQGVTAWSVAGCSGPTCDVTVSADTSVTANVGQLGYLAFATDALYDGDLLGDPAPADAEADAICNAAAAGAGLPGTYRAWLSSTTVSAASRFAGARGGWVRPDGVPVAGSLAALTSAQLLSTINITELGNQITNNAELTFWTNTLPSGAIAVTSAAQTCQNFTSTSGASGSSVLGRTTEAGTEWTSLPGNFQNCSQPAHLACFQVSTSGPTYPVPAGPRLAADATPIFVSQATFQGNAGLAAMDGACNSEAAAAGLPGTYVALVSTTSASAGSRVPRPTPWARTDGRAAILGAIYTQQLPVLFDASAQRSSAADHVATWTGMSFSYNDLSSTGESCLDWTTASASEGARPGHPSSLYAFSGGTGLGCDQRWPVYCVRAM